MQKKLFKIFFLICAINFSSTTYSKNTNICSDLNNQKFKNIKSIKVEVEDFRKWTLNGIRIITGNFRWVPEKFKKRYKSKIFVIFDDNSKCSLKGLVRHNGNQKDHIQLVDNSNSIIQSLDVNLKLITDGDISGAILVSKESYNIDIFLGIGGGPEGVLAASALDAYNCFFQGRFIFDNESDINRAKEIGITDLNKKYLLNEIVTGDSIFCATGITNGDIVSGIKIDQDSYVSETLITHKSANMKKIIKLKKKK